MLFFRREILCAGFLLGSAFLAGCRSDAARPVPSAAAPAAVRVAPNPQVIQASQTRPATVIPASDDGNRAPVAQQASLSTHRLHSQPVLASAHSMNHCDVIDDPFAGYAELSADAVVDVVLARNRSLDAMQSAWRATAARYPQAVSLDDPEVMSLMAPDSFGDKNFESSFMVGASQKLPWPGKRGLRGEAVRADTAAAYMDAGELATKLDAAARMAFVDYFLARRQLVLLEENFRQLEQLRTLAQNKYESRSATQQDMLQADVDLAELARRRVELAQAEMIAVARINTLAHRLPDMQLPPPPRTVGQPFQLPEVLLLHQVAISQRPDLAAIGARVRAEQVAVQLANKEYLPDFDVGGRYDQFWDRVNQRGQLGINMNVPLYQQRRNAAVREANFRWSQRRAEYDQAVDDVRNEVQSAYARTEASRQVLELYNGRIVEAAQQNVEAARAGYEANNLGFLALVEAQRQLIDVQMKQLDSLADYHRRLAELQQAIGGRMPQLPGVEEIPLPPQN